MNGLFYSSYSLTISFLPTVLIILFFLLVDLDKQSTPKYSVVSGLLTCEKLLTSILDPSWWRIFASPRLSARAAHQKASFPH